MFILKSDKTLFVDVDDTLVMWSNDGTYKPHFKHIGLIKRFYARKQPIIVWSAGGWRWALQIVKELNLESYVTAVMSKPSWFVDDLPSSHWLPESNRMYIKYD